MLGMILMLAPDATVAAAPEVTPAFTAGPSAATQFDGLCSGGSVSLPARVAVSWTASNFDSALHDYKVYEDGILVATQSTSPYVKVVTGFISNGFFHPTFKDWTFRVDIIRKSDSVVLASGSVDWSAYYYLCS